MLYSDKKHYLWSAKRIKTLNMKIIESKIVGKKSQESCEDGMVITDDFIAVIDGSTSKTPKHLNPDMKNGRYAMMLISEYIREELKADASVDDFCQGVSAYIYNKVYEKLGVEKRLKEHPEERLTASDGGRLPGYHRWKAL